MSSRAKRIVQQSLVDSGPNRHRQTTNVPLQAAEKSFVPSKRARVILDSDEENSMPNMSDHSMVNTINPTNSSPKSGDNDSNLPSGHSTPVATPVSTLPPPEHDSHEENTMPDVSDHSMVNTINPTNSSPKSGDNDSNLPSGHSTPVATPVSTLPRPEDVVTNSTSVSTPSSSIPSNSLSTSMLTPTSSHSTSITGSARRRLLDTTKNYIEKLLDQSADGKIITNFFDKHNRLDDSLRSALVKILMTDELKEDFSKIVSSERFENISEAICQVFPTESTFTYFIPYYRDKDGNSHPSRGKLFDKYNSLRRKYKQEGLILGRKRRSLSGAPANNGGADSAITPEVQEKIAFLKNSAEPWETVVEYWECTIKCRLNEIDPDSINEYFKTYLALCKPNGHLLLEADFRKLYPTKTTIFYKNWKSVETKILKLAEIKSARPLFSSLLKSLDIDLSLNDPESQSANACFLLSALLPALTVKQGWKPSRIENKRGFIIHQATKEEAEEEFSRRSEKLQSKGVGPQPSIILIGDLPDVSAFVRVDQTYYSCDTVQRSVDLCFKIHKSLKLNFAPDCLLNWLFIEQYIYEFDCKYDLQYASLARFMNDLV